MQAFFDLEGPLSPQDNAYELMGLVERGHELFELLSRYDDILAMEGREDYEAGDTLKLIVPFLVYHGISGEDVRKVSERAMVVEGAEKLISELKAEGWRVYIISTSYRQHAENIATRLGVDSAGLACTQLELTSYGEIEGSEIVQEVEEELLEELPVPSDKDIKRILDDFFLRRLKGKEMGELLGRVEVVGGARKVRAMKDFLRRDGGKVSRSVAVGDSITDFKMLRELRGRGLAIVFNGNRYSLPYGDIGVASQSLYTLKPLFEAFAEGRREKALSFAGRDERFAVIGDSSLEELLEEHGRYRRLVRGQASKLG